MKFNHILSGLALTAAVLAAGCQKSLEYSDVVYFTGTENSNITNMYVDGPSSMGVTVTSSCKMAADVQVALAVDAAAVDAYNALHGTDYRMLPAGSYRLSDDAVTIAEGTNVSTPSSFEIVSMDDFDEGAHYCVPLKITGTSNGMGVLEASRTQYIFISQITTTRGINLKNSWYITMDGMVDDPALKDLPACTMEIRMYANGWRTSGHMISSLIGVEENFLLRVGDESIKNPAQLQLAGRGTSITAPNALSLGRWYHIAVVDNGSEMTIYIDGNAEISVDSSSSKAINLGFYYNSPFAIGMSAADVRYFNGYVSEARVWKRALTPTELKNNQCYVDPATAEGLIGYWRSADLVNWSDESHISIKDVKNADGTPALPANETVHCFWAPQVIWDDSTGKYMVYFSLSTSSFTGGSEQKIYYMLTDNLMDVTHYSAPQLLYKNPNGDVSIDADIMYDSANGIYYMYYKNEADGEKTIYYVSSTDLKDADQYSACTPVKVYNSRSTGEVLSEPIFCR